MADANLTVAGIIQKIYANYINQTSPKARVLDGGAFASVATVALLILYSLAAGTHFPFNAFLAAVFGCLGSAVLIRKFLLSV